MTREEWLNKALLEIIPIFEGKGISWPNTLKIRASCGFPSSNALSRRSRTIGQCHKTEWSGDKTNEIFISPVIDNPLEAIATLTHEMVHVLDDCKSGHKGAFRRTMKLVGLEGKPTHTHAGEELTVRLNTILEGLGAYPHHALNPVAREKKQTTRLLKAMCSGCGYIIRVTPIWADTGLPVCNTCKREFELKGEDVWKSGLSHFPMENIK